MLNKNKINRIITCIISIIVLVIIDQVTKAWAVARLESRPPIELIKGALEFYYLPNGNTGAAFGMLQGHQGLFLIIACVISVVLFIIIYSMPLDKKYDSLVIVMTMIISGGIGNMIDRIRLDYVIDFIYISLINFPIFNVADMYVSIGTVVLCVLLLFCYKEEDITIIEKNVTNIFKKNNH